MARMLGNANVPGRQRRKSSLAFPHQPASERGGFIRYMEDSGAVSLFSDVFSALYSEPEKPENPLEWIRKYLRGKAEDRKEVLLSALESRTGEILELAQELDELKQEKAHYEQLIQGVQSQLHLCSPTARNDIVDEKYVENGGDSRWQVQPDPSFVGAWAKDEIAIQMKKAAAQQRKLESSTADASEDDERKIRTINLEGNDVPYNDDHNLAPFYSMLEKSTETSPQPSFHDIATEMEDDEDEWGNSFAWPGARSSLAESTSQTSIPSPSEEELPAFPLNSSHSHSASNVESKKTSVQPPAKDTTVAAVIPQKAKVSMKSVKGKKKKSTGVFWAEDFSLGKVETSDDESDDEYSSPQMASIRAKLQAKRYRALSLQEHAWLPWKSEDHYPKESLKSPDPEIIIKDVLGTLTVTRLPLEKELKIVQAAAELAAIRDPVARYEWVKKEYGVQMLRAVHRGKTLIDDIHAPPGFHMHHFSHDHGEHHYSSGSGGDHDHKPEISNASEEEVDGEN